MVDDNIQMTELFKEYFEKENVTIDFAENGEEGVKKALEYEYRIIFMDLNMPVLNGVEAAIKLRQLEKKRNFICAFTGHSDQISIADKELFNVVLDKNNLPQLLKSIKNLL